MLTKIILEDISEILEETKKDILRLAGKSILITGGTGMMGRYIVYTLMEANKHFFKKPVTLYIVTRTQKRPFGINKNIHYLNIDIAKKVPHLTKIQFMIHAASKAAPKFYLVDRIDTLNTNILGLYHLLQISDKHLESFLYFSSCDIYGETITNKPITEDYIGKIDHLNLRSCYSQAKRTCETICMNYYWEKKFPVKIARIFHTFGPGLNLNDGRSFSDFIRFGLEQDNIKILGDKNKKRSLLYVKDAAIMFLKLLLSDKNGQIYNIGNDKNIVSIGKFAEIVCHTFNKEYKENFLLRNKNKIRVIYNNRNNIQYYKGAVNVIKPDISKFKMDFHYKPTTAVEEAVFRTVNHYLEIQDHVK